MRVFVFLLAGLLSTAVAEASAFGDSSTGSGIHTRLAQAETPQAPPAPSAGSPDAGDREPTDANGPRTQVHPEIDLTEPDPTDTGPDGMSPENLSIGDIPVIETVELTPETAKKALDVYFLATEKYESADLESYENLQDFVDQNPMGKSFEADVKAAGFANVTEWNTAFSAVGFAYATIVDDQTEDIKAQIAELEEDTELAADMKNRMIASLKATIPSENNKKVIEQLLDDPVYGDKLKQLDLGEE